MKSAQVFSSGNAAAGVPCPGKAAKKIPHLRGIRTIKDSTLMAERTIREILKEQAQLLARLEEALDQEFSLLKERKALELPELSKVKTDILLKIQTNDSSIKNHPEKDLLKTDLLRAKNLLLDRLAEVKRKNEVNGRLIELNLAASRRLSSSLVQIRDTSTVTYDERGNKNALAGLHLDFEA